MPIKFDVADKQQGIQHDDSLFNMEYVDDFCLICGSDENQYD